MPKPESSFIKRFYTAALGGLISPYGDIMDRKATPAMVVMATNNKLPSFQRGQKYNRAQGMMHALNPLNALREYNYMDWIGGFGIMPLLNVIQLGLTSGLEIGFRTAGLFLTHPANTFLNWIILDVDNEKSMAEKIFAGAGAVLLSPFWCIGQALTLVADVFSYTRSLLDSTMYLVNPLWWMSVAGMLPDDKAPSLGVVAKTFFTSLFQLIPAAIIIAAAAMTAGASLPGIHAVSGPLAALGPQIGTALTGAWTAIATKTAIGIFVAGAIAIAAKFISVGVGEAFRRLTDDSKPAEKKADPAPNKKKREKEAFHHSDRDIAEQAGFTRGAHPHDHETSVRPDRPSINSLDDPGSMLRDAKKLSHDEGDSETESDSRKRQPGTHR